MTGRRQLLSGWGRTAPTGSEVVLPPGRSLLSELLRGAPSRGVVARGLGRSYGDAAQNAGGRVVDMTSLSGVLAFDPVLGRIRAEAGLSLDALMRQTIPFGWFPHVSPGTRQVTLGGALAADIHGKNHHRDGSFSEGVRSFELLAPAFEGEITAESHPDFFWATAGGMGLTGLVSALELQLRSISTSRMVVDTERASDLDDLLARMTARDDEYHYSVAWIDLLASGTALGRSVLTRGDHATPDQLPALERQEPLRFHPRSLAAAPPWVPSGLLNRLTVRAFNELWFRKAPKERRDEIQSIGAFFHPLDGVAGWNRIYGPRGFLQYQFVVPFGEESTLGRIVERLVAAQLPSFLAVLKRFGEGGPGHLSFPAPGWTLALDIPAGIPSLEQLLRGFDEAVASVGGRVYLAKDSRLRSDMVRQMYPRLDEWRVIQETLDPDHRVTSDLDRRLRLTRGQR